MKHVFICHSSQDKAIAETMVDALESRNIRCWISSRDIPLYAEWAATIVDAIESSSILILVHSSNSNESKQVHREISQADNLKIPIILFKIDDTPLSKSLKYFMSTYQWLDASKLPMEKHLQKLSDDIQELYTKGVPVKELQPKPQQYIPMQKTAESALVNKDSNTMPPVLNTNLENESNAPVLDEVLAKVEKKSMISSYREKDENIACPVCGSRNNKGLIYCRKCSSKLQETMRNCQSCGSSIPNLAKYCRFCGAKSV